jgi:hypothetical protein
MYLSQDTLLPPFDLLVLFKCPNLFYCLTFKLREKRVASSNIIPTFEIISTVLSTRYVNGNLQFLVLMLIANTNHCCLNLRSFGMWHRVFWYAFLPAEFVPTFQTIPDHTVYIKQGRQFTCNVTREGGFLSFIVALEKQKVLHILSGVFSLSFQSAIPMRHIFINGLYKSTIFFHIIS